MPSPRYVKARTRQNTARYIKAPSTLVGFASPKTHQKLRVSFLQHFPAGIFPLHTKTRDYVSFQ